jgi:hypothetical protein
MATKKFIIEVEEGRTECGKCYIKSYSTVESIGTVHYNLACTGKCEKYEKED